MTAAAIKPTCDRKTRRNTSEKNTFGLLPGPLKDGGSCPDCTTGPGGCMYVSDGRKLPTCYVFKTMVYAPQVRVVLQHNTNLLMSVRGPERIKLFTDEFKRFHKAGGTHYRIHWAGDCPDLEYACDLAEAMKTMNGKVRFWGYSRSLFTVAPMASVPNLVWYISIDDLNVDRVMTFMSALYPSVLEGRGPVYLAYMSKTKPEGNGLTRAVACPVDSGIMAIDEACQKCGLCLNGATIWFKQK